MIPRVAKAAWSYFANQREHLATFALGQVLLLAVGLFVAKAIASAHAFAGSTFLEAASAWVQGLPLDLLFIGTCGVVALVVRHWHCSSIRIRLAMLILLQGVVLIWLSLTFINVEIYRSMGSPLKFHLMLLLPNSARYLLGSALADKWWIAVAIVFGLILIAALGPFASRVMRPISTRPLIGYVLFLSCLLGGGILLSRPASGVRETALRKMTVFSMLVPENVRTSKELAPPTPVEIQTLARICGPQRQDTQAAFETFPRKKYNVVLIGWESVGQRFLKSQHPLGEALTPRIDEMLSRGSVRYSQCYSECPFTTQTAWTVLTGQSPPARPLIFMFGSQLPAFRVMLPNILRESGFATAHFHCSFVQVGGIDKFLNVAGFDIWEDFSRFTGRDKYPIANNNVEDIALVERSTNWIDSLPKNKPFFLHLWNTITHYPYEFAAMTPEQRKAKDLERYYISIKESDRVFGLLYDEFQKRGLIDNTIFIIFGDHGQGMGRPPRPYERMHAMMVYEDSVHVPLYVIHPGLKKQAAQALDVPCTLSDIVPTILDLTGQPIPEALEGQSLAKPYTVKPFLLRSIVWWPVAIRAGNYKLILDSPEGTPELFDVSKDMYEKNNLANREIDLSNTLTAQIFRRTADRFRTDPSFDYGYALNPSLNDETKSKDHRPDLDELLRRQSQK